MLAGGLSARTLSVNSVVAAVLVELREGLVIPTRDGVGVKVAQVGIFFQKGLGALSPVDSIENGEAPIATANEMVAGDTINKEESCAGVKIFDVCVLCQRGVANDERIGALPEREMFGHGQMIVRL